MNTQYVVPNSSTTLSMIANKNGIPVQTLIGCNPTLKGYSGNSALPMGTVVDLCTAPSTGSYGAATASFGATAASNTLAGQFSTQIQTAIADMQKQTTADLAAAQKMTPASCQSMLSKIMTKLGNIKTSSNETLTVTVGPIDLINGVNDWHVVFKSNSHRLLSAIQSAIPEHGTLNASAGTLSYPIDKLYKFAVDAEFCISNYGQFSAAY